MKTTFLYLFLVMGLIASAQQADSLPRQRKNQFFTNLVPVLMPAFGAIPEQYSLRLGYERSIKSNWALRGVVSFNSKNHLNDHCGYNVLSFTDTLMIREYELEYGTPEFRLGFGARKMFVRPAITWYAGADIYGSYSKNNAKGYSSTWKLDSAASAASGEDVWFPQSTNDGITRWVETKNHDLGISPFFGAEKNLGKRFSLSAQFGFDVFWRDTYLKRRYPEEVAWHYYSYNVNIAGMVNELALRYRF